MTAEKTEIGSSARQTLGKNRPHIMIDLETLGTKPGDVILSIGAVADRGIPVPPPVDEVRGEFFCTIEIESSIWAGLRADPGTVAWWKSQDTGARARLRGEPHYPVDVALRAFSTWLSNYPGAWLWGDSAAFDLGLTAAAYRKCGLELPWGYRQEMCYRTLKQARPDIKKPYNALGHDALTDARTQLQHLLELLPAVGWAP